MATEALFYHLERSPLERTLPVLLEKTLERGWRAVVQAGSQERLDALDQQLWTWRDESFLPHGTSKDGNAERQPVWLTTGSDNPNGATVRFLVDGAEPGDISGLDRLVIMFDGHDQAAVEAAREHWKTLKAAGCEVTYWQQADSGAWTRKA
ncbi:MAG: DNA polymerase III subunit chi [Hyphomicrobiaceae bacterium]